MKFFLLGQSNGDTNPRDQRGETPLHWAAWNGHFHVCKLILDNTGVKNPEDNIGWTPLHAAAEKGHLAICHMIIKNIETNESKKLSDKVHDKNKYLLWLWEAGFEEPLLAPQGGSELRNPGNRTGITPLHVAAQNGHLQVCKLLIQSTDDKNPKAKHDGTPLHYAAKMGHLDICKLIMENISDKNPHDSFSKTPFKIAAEYGHQDICDLITKKIKEQMASCDLIL